MLEIERFRTSDAAEPFLEQLRDLLWSAFGDQFSESDWEHGLGGQHIAIRDPDLLVAHAAVVPRRLHVGDKVLSAGYVENVATRPDRQRTGLGTLAMIEANAAIAETFDIGALSSGSHRFYRRLGWESWQGPSYVVTGSQWTRSEDEDEGIMVMRLEACNDVDLGSRIACDARAGDDW